MAKSARHFKEIEALEIFPGLRSSLALPPPKENVRGFFVVVAVLGVVVFFVFKLAIIEHGYFLRAAQENVQKVILNPAQRGSIFSRDGETLAQSIPAFDLRIDLKEFFSNIESSRQAIEFLYQQGLRGRIATALSDLTEQSTELIVHDIPRDSAFAILAVQQQYPGVTVLGSFTREYPQKEVFSSVVGYIGKISRSEYGALENYRLDDVVGRSGVEAYYESVLRGLPEKMFVERDAIGRIMKIVPRNQAVPGDELVLTLDSRLQSALFYAMRDAFVDRGFQKGAAVALNPVTGEILALVSFPSFDANAFVRGDASYVSEILANQNQPLFNRVIAGLYNPGSTIKPLVALAALENHIIEPSKQILANGFISIQNPYDPEKFSIFRDWKVHGWVDMRRALAYSANVYFYAIGGGYEDQPGIGISKLKEYFEKFMLNAKFGIDLPGEVAGFVPSPEWKAGVNPDDPLWRVGDTYNISIGQGALVVTPLQIAAWTAAIANDGTLMRPYLLSELRNSAGKTISEKTPQVLAQNLAGKDALRVVREGMRMTVTQGTGALLSDLPIAVAGKSGTAQISGTQLLNAIFTSFFPYENPKIVLTVLVENVKEGSVAAIPIVKDAIKRYYGFK